MGERTIRTPETRRVILDSLDNGATRTAACQAAGIARSAFYRWMQDDPDFADEVDQRWQASIMAVEDALYRDALEGKTTAQIFFLLNRAPDRWQDRRNLRVSGDPDGPPIAVQVEEDYLDRRLRELVEAEQRADTG